MSTNDKSQTLREFADIVVMSEIENPLPHIHCAPGDCLLHKALSASLDRLRKGPPRGKRRMGKSSGKTSQSS